MRELDELGFIWCVKPRDSVRTFDDWMKELAAFKLTHGHCDIPRTLEDNMGLARWAHVMRQSYRELEQGGKPSFKLAKEHIQRLQSIGFRLKVAKRSQVKKKSFEERINALKAYRLIHGHIHVTVKESQDLSMFCTNIRIARQNPAPNSMKITDERIRALDALQFDWGESDKRKKKRLMQALKKFVEEHGTFPTASMHGGLSRFCNRIRKGKYHLGKEDSEFLESNLFDCSLEKRSKLTTSTVPTSYLHLQQRTGVPQLGIGRYQINQVSNLAMC